MSIQAFFKLLMAKDISATSFIFFPAASIFVWIVPQQISYDSRIWDFARFWNILDLFKALHIFGNAAVHTHNFFIYQGHEWHVVKTVIKLLPNVDFVSPFNFVEKPIDTGDCLRFMVASQNNNLIRKSDF